MPPARRKTNRSKRDAGNVPRRQERGELAPLIRGHSLGVRALEELVERFLELRVPVRSFLGTIGDVGSPTLLKHLPRSRLALGGGRLGGRRCRGCRLLRGTVAAGLVQCPQRRPVL